MQLCTCSTLFLCISLSLFCTTTTWNFQKRLSYTFFGGNVVRVLVHLFFTAAHFHLALVAASISHFVTAPTKFSCCSSNKKCIFKCARVYETWKQCQWIMRTLTCKHKIWGENWLYLRPYLKTFPIFNVLETCREYFLTIGLGIVEFIKNLSSGFWT